MANSIFGGSQPSTPIPNNQMLQQFRQFQQTFKGDPKQTVMNMLSQGQINNNQLQQAIQMAKQMQHMFK